MLPDVSSYALSAPQPCTALEWKGGGAQLLARVYNIRDKSIRAANHPPTAAAIVAAIMMR
jgi:hypothetical protein